MRKILIIDTSILCVWLKVTNMEVCGPDDDKWDFLRVDSKIRKEQSAGTTFVLTIATIIETGNHIAHAHGDRFALGKALGTIIDKVVEEKSPWAAFTEQSELWKPENLKRLSDKWQTTVAQGQSLGDASIVDVAEYFAEAGFEVEIFTGDQGLKSYEPAIKPFVPRRRRR